MCGDWTSGTNRENAGALAVQEVLAMLIEEELVRAGLPPYRPGRDPWDDEPEPEPDYDSDDEPDPKPK